MKSIITIIRNRGALLRSGLLAALGCAVAVSPVRADYSIFTDRHDFDNPDTSSWPYTPPTNGTAPYGAVTFSPDGSKAYGMTRDGGSLGYGVIFAMNADGSGYTVLHNFGTTPGDGKAPYGSLILSHDGTMLYGMTSDGGWFGLGTVFGICADGTSCYGSLHDFGDPTVSYDGKVPYGDLVLNHDGTMLYGMTAAGGAFGENGVVFECSTDDTIYNILHNFGSSPTDGKKPLGSLTLNPGGYLLYGMTSEGGTHGKGTIFSFTPAGVGYTTLRNFGDFSGPYADGQKPYGSLTFSPDGSEMYGMTSAGGSTGHGVVFEMDEWAMFYVVIHNFASGYPHDGTQPFGSLTFGANGTTLYGMTAHGGTAAGSSGCFGFAGDGTIFSIQADGSGYGVVHSFHYDGEFTSSSLTLNPCGCSLYGMATSGGSNCGGTLFSLAEPVVATPTIWYPSPGPLTMITYPLTVTISCATPGATIYYTTDGTAPTTSSPVYTGPFTVYSGLHIQAIALLSGDCASPVASRWLPNYLVPPTPAPVIIRGDGTGGQPAKF